MNKVTAYNQENKMEEYEMALIKCSECGKDISDKASACPHCGCPLSNAEQSQKNKKEKGMGAKSTKILIATALIVGVIIVFAILILTHTICLNHDYSDASVLEPQTCYHCGKTRGEPKSLMKIQFPTQGVGSLLPTPSSNMGEIKWEDADSFSAYVGNMTEDEFNAYVQMCAENGFDVDYQKGEDYYYADDANGNNLNIWYKGNDIIDIQIVASYEDETDTPSGGEEENASTADKDFLAEIEATVLERMDTPTNTNRERKIAVDAELYQISPFAEKEFLDAQLKQLAIQYIDGLKLQKEASEAEHDYEEPITWYEGLVTCYEVLNALHQSYDFLSDNSKFIATYVLQLNEMQALLTAYNAVGDDLSQQLTDGMLADYDGTNMSLPFSNNTEYEYSTIWKITYFDKNGNAVGTASAEVENISARQNYTVYLYVPFRDKTEYWELDAYFTSVVLPDENEDEEQLFVAKGETSLMNFLDAASNNGYEIIDPQRDGSYVNAKAKKGSVTFSIQYMVENQKVYMVEVVLDIFGEIDSAYTDCIAGLAKALNPNIDSTVLNQAIEEALTTPNQRVVKSETLFLFDDDEGVFTVTH